ncbi:MAG: Ca2+-dependent phosphoinositide-specific phospholipase C [Myxococcota bacterium]|nr:Ca2+-dependent phosphoinositide-specific phospholipase C [Myxococcota bacterium]
MPYSLLRALCALALGCTGCAPDASSPWIYPHDDQLRLHHLQLKGTHNSYHLEPEAPVYEGHRYSHLSLDRQLDEQGVRVMELDLHYEGAGAPIKILHLGLVDENTSCSTLKACLRTIKGWSDKHRGHLPILVWLELKFGVDGAETEVLQDVERVIEGIFPRDRLLTVDAVKGSHPSLRQALTNEGWPLLGDVRGRVAFINMNSGAAMTNAYLALHPNALGGVLFPSSGTLTQFDEPWAAFTKINDPNSPQEITAALERRILVASNLCLADFSDAECRQREEVALSHGVAMLKGDFPAPVDERDYWFEFPGGASARCNPLTAPEICTPEALENL